MRSAIGPREVFFVDKDGASKSITITIELGARNAVNLPGGDKVEEHLATIHLQSYWFDRTMTARGADDLQAIYWCLRLGDIWLQKACKDAGVTLFTIVPDRPAEQPFDVFA